MAIYYLCPEIVHPCGGVKVIYRHVDILNRNGIHAYVLHQKRGFRCTWFSNDTRIAYTKQRLDSFIYRLRNKLKKTKDPGAILTIPIIEGGASEIGPDDYLVIPEQYGPDLASIGRGIPRVILNQGCFMTFYGYSFNKDRLKTPYSDPTVREVLANSDHGKEYVRYAFPGAKVRRFYLSIDPKQFFFQAQKKKQICFSRVKNSPDALQVINMLKFRGALADFEIVPFVNISQEEVAHLLRESLIFLNLGNREGFGLPAAEAMACGCLVIGYHGWGGKEFFKPEFSFPVEDGDIIGFAKGVEGVIQDYTADSNYFFEQRRNAAQFIADNYSPGREERELLRIWTDILHSKSDRP